MSSSSTLAICVSIYFNPLARVSARSFYSLPFKLLFIHLSNRFIKTCL